MYYQALARLHAEAAWEPFLAMTRDPMQAMRALQLASRRFPEVTIIQAESAQRLREQAQRLRAGEPTGDGRSPVPSLSATPRVSILSAKLEAQRWAIEEGPGGDHDTPYHLELPAAGWLLARWARMIARQAPGDETLAQLAHLVEVGAQEAAGDDEADAPLAEATPDEALAPARRSTADHATDGLL